MFSGKKIVEYMSQIKRFTLLLCAVMVPLFWGCEPIDTTPGAEPIVTLDIYELDVDGGGGDIPIFYSVENEVRGARIKAKSNVEWAKIKEITSYSIIVSVAESDIDEQRLGYVTISYEGMEKDIRVRVLQDKQRLSKFRFEILELEPNSCTVKYTPKSSGKWFMANIIDASYLTEAGISDMNLFIEAEMSNYLALAQANDITLQFLLEEAASPRILHNEEVTRSFTGMRPGGSYMVYAYGLELDGDEYTVTTPFHYTTVQTPMSKFYDLTFNISSQIASSGIASIAVTPVDWSGYYAITIIPDSSIYYVQKGQSMQEYTLRALGDEFYKRARQAMRSGMSAEAFLKGSCYSGAHTLNTSLNGGSSYMVVVYAVESVDDGIPVMCSIPSISYL